MNDQQVTATNTKGQKIEVGATVVYKKPYAGYKQRDKWYKRDIIRLDREGEKTMAVFRVSYGKHGIQEERRDARFCYLPRS